MYVYHSVLENIHVCKLTNPHDISWERKFLCNDHEFVVSLDSDEQTLLNSPECIMNLILGHMIHSQRENIWIRVHANSEFPGSSYPGGRGIVIGKLMLQSNKNWRETISMENHGL